MGDRHRCENCQHNETECEAGHIKLCAAPTVLEDEGLDRDDVDAAVRRFMQSRDVQCPHYRAHWWMDPAEAEAFLTHAEKKENNDG